MLPAKTPKKRLSSSSGALEKFVRTRGKIRGKFYSTPEFRKFFANNSRSIITALDLVLKYEQNLIDGLPVNVTDKRTGVKIVSRSSLEGFQKIPGNNNQFIVKVVVGGFEFFVKKEKRKATEDWKIAEWEDCDRKLKSRRNQYLDYHVQVLKPMLIYGHFEITPFFRSGEVIALESFCEKHPERRKYFTNLIRDLAHDVGLLGMDLKNVLYNEKNKELFLVDIHG
jgi:hypothetical protein